MAITDGVTEVQDSEEEPMTSSPIKFPDIVVDKVSTEGPDQGPQVCVVPGSLDRSTPNRNHHLGVDVEPKIEIRPNLPKQPVTDTTLNVEHAEIDEQLCVGQNSEKTNLPFVIEESKPPSTSQVLLKSSLNAARHSSLPQELCASSIPPCDLLAQAVEHPPVPVLDYMNEKLQQVQPDLKEQNKLYQADNNTVSDPAVNAPSPFPTAFTEYEERMSAGPVPLGHARTGYSGAEINTIALSMETYVPAIHSVSAQTATNAEHDAFHTIALPTPVAMKNTNNDPSIEAILESSLLAESQPVKEIAIKPATSEKPGPINDKDLKANNCDAPIAVNEPILGAEPSQKGRTSSSSIQINKSQPARDHLSTQQGLQRAQSYSISGLPDNAAASAVAAEVDTETDSSLPANVLITTAYPTSSEPPSTSLTQSVIPKTPQEITLAELRAQKGALLASLLSLPAIQVVIEEQAALNAETSEDGGEPGEADVMAAANRIVKDHIKLLHEYNELKDMGQGLMGLIADQRGVRIVEIQSEFGIEAQD